MKAIIVEGTEKEIAALVAELQERHEDKFVPYTFEEQEAKKKANETVDF